MAAPPQERPWGVFSLLPLSEEFATVQRAVVLEGKISRFYFNIIL
jgi:hypothetical protein